MNTLYSEIRDYARGRLRPLGYTEWEDALNFENIPRTRLDRAFHLGSMNATTLQLNNDNSYDRVTFELSLFYKGFRSTGESMDRVQGFMDDVYKSFMEPKNRFTQRNVKNLSLQNSFIDPLPTNDNFFRAVMNFNFDVIVEMIGEGYN